MLAVETICEDNVEHATRLLQSKRDASLGLIHCLDLELDPVTSLVFDLTQHSSSHELSAAFGLSFANLAPITSSIAYLHHNVLRPITIVALKCLLSPSRSAGSGFHLPLRDHFSMLIAVHCRLTSTCPNSFTLYHAMQSCQLFLSQSVTFLQLLLDRHAVGGTWKFFRSMTASQLLEQQLQMQNILTICNDNQQPNVPHRNSLFTFFDRITQIVSNQPTDSTLDLSAFDFTLWNRFFGSSNSHLLIDQCHDLHAHLQRRSLLTVLFSPSGASTATTQQHRIIQRLLLSHDRPLAQSDHGRFITLSLCATLLELWCNFSHGTLQDLVQFIDCIETLIPCGLCAFSLSPKLTNLLSPH